VVHVRVAATLRMGFPVRSMSWRSRGDSLTRPLTNHSCTRSARLNEDVGPGAEHGFDLQL